MGPFIFLNLSHIIIVFNNIDKNIFNNFEICFSYQDALSLIVSKQINLKPLLTHGFKIDGLLKVFKTVETGVGDSNESYDTL